MQQTYRFYYHKILGDVHRSLFTLHKNGISTKMFFNNNKLISLIYLFEILTKKETKILKNCIFFLAVTKN